MKFNNREEIKEILEMDITNEEKRNLIANIKNIKADLGRVIRVDEELNIKVGDIWNNLNQATSWTNRDKENESFKTENDGEIEYILQFENGEIEGYEVQYLQFDELVDNGMDEDEAEELAEDEIYLELMDLLGSDAEMKLEAEVLVPAETKFEIVEINDGREDVGYIEIILKEVKSWING